MRLRTPNIALRWVRRAGNSLRDKQSECAINEEFSSRDAHFVRYVEYWLLRYFCWVIISELGKEGTPSEETVPYVLDQ